MPVFSFGALARTADGRMVPSSAALRERLMRIPVTLSVHPAAEKRLVVEGATPSVVKGDALVDTGASVTCIDRSAAGQLNLMATGVKTTGTAAGPQQVPVFAFRLAAQAGQQGFVLECTSGLGCDLVDHGLVALIGMDLLSRCVLVLNGPTGMYTLAM